jgi:hypothetical protein
LIPPHPSVKETIAGFSQYFGYPPLFLTVLDERNDANDLSYANLVHKLGLILLKRSAIKKKILFIE